MKEEVIYTERQKFCQQQWIKHPIKNLPKMIYPDWMIVGENCFINETVVAEPHGFGYEKFDGNWILIPHSGKIIIGDNVDVHNLTVIVRGTSDDSVTRIGSGTKIDTLCHIAHNVSIGQNCLITSGSIIGGSVVIGDNCYLGINCVIRNKVKIGNNVTVGMGAVVTKDVPDGCTVYGNPAKIISKDNA